MHVNAVWQGLYVCATKVHIKFLDIIAAQRYRLMVIYGKQHEDKFYTANIFATPSANRTK